MNSYLIEFEALPWENPALGVRTKTCVQGDRKLRLVEFAKEFVEQEWCTNDHMGFVLEGEMEVNFNGVVKRYKAGDGMFIPKGEQNKHRHHATGKTTKLFLVEEA
ncbi:MAG: cupin domain-containing protein [Nitrospirae bacterium]|nr:cupin domain-containing protein [Nitrospirota bacterium]